MLSVLTPLKSYFIQIAMSQLMSFHPQQTSDIAKMISQLYTHTYIHDSNVDTHLPLPISGITNKIRIDCMGILLNLALAEGNVHQMLQIVVMIFFHSKFSRGDNIKSESVSDQKNTSHNFHWLLGAETTTTTTHTQSKSNNFFAKQMIIFRHLSGILLDLPMLQKQEIPEKNHPSTISHSSNSFEKTRKNKQLLFRSGSETNMKSHPNFNVSGEYIYINTQEMHDPILASVSYDSLLLFDRQKGFFFFFLT